MGSSKEVRFDQSLESSPSNLRSKARATDPYRGQQFVGADDEGNVPTASRGPQKRASDLSHMPPDVEELARQRPGFVFNKEGSFTLDYPDDSREDAPGLVPEAAAVKAMPSVNGNAEDKEHERQ